MSSGFLPLGDGFQAGRQAASCCDAIRLINLRRLWGRAIALDAIGEIDTVSWDEVGRFFRGG